MNSIIEAEIIAADKQLRYVTIATSAMQVEENEIVQLIVRDITESKKAVEEAKTLARFPGEDPNPVMRISTDSKILYANDSSAPVLDTWKTQIGENLPEPWSTRIEEVYNSGNGKTFELTCDDGHIFIITLEPITGSDYVNAYGLDVTNNKKSEQTIILKDHIPISGNQEISVKLIQPVFKENGKELTKNDEQILTWTKRIKSKEKLSLPFSFSVEYPAGVRLSGIESWS